MAAQAQPIALVGLAGRFPGAETLADFWTLLASGGDAVRELPPGRWDAEAYLAPAPGAPGCMLTSRGGYLDGVDLFDAPLFGISAREAAFMDPQQRLVLETVWRALEDAGLPPARLAGSRTGVFIGISNFDYNRLICRSRAQLDAYASTGTILAISANRVSYVLNLRGPSLAVDTACSSSLVAAHLARQSLLAGECDVALCGGVNLILSPEVTVILTQGGLLSPGGRCRSFDAAADGYVRGEGCGMAVLKRLDDARRARDRVRALLLGSAVNQDGATNGLTAPSATAQQAVLREALAAAGLPASAVQCLEAHGSGTRLGDIIEMRALKAVLLEGREASLRCAVGSVKANVGHLESAAGVAGLAKMILALEAGVIPPVALLGEPNPHLRLDGTPLYLPREAVPWPRGGVPRVAGVSSFGIGGTNAHVIVCEAPAEQPEPERDGPRLLTLSARTPAALREAVRGLHAFLRATPDARLDDLSYTTLERRAHFAERVALVARDRDEALARLAACLDAGPAPGTWRGSAPPGAEPPPFVVASADDLEAAARCYVAGASLQTSALHDAPTRRPLPLPGHVFERRRYWFDEAEAAPSRRAPRARGE